MTDAQFIQLLGGLAVFLYLLPGFLPLSGPARYRVQWAAALTLAAALGYALWLVAEWVVGSPNEALASQFPFH